MEGVARQKPGWADWRGTTWTLLTFDVLMALAVGIVLPYSIAFLLDPDILGVASVVLGSVPIVLTVVTGGAYGLMRYVVMRNDWERRRREQERTGFCAGGVGRNGTTVHPYIPAEPTFEVLRLLEFEAERRARRRPDAWRGSAYEPPTGS